MNLKNPDTEDWYAAGKIAKAVRQSIIEEQSGQSHGAVAAQIRQINAAIRKPTKTTIANGVTYAKKLSGANDQILRTLFNQCAPPTLPVCLIAVGGYGRGLLAPYSDIDLLILHKNANASTLQSFLDQLLYPLWDSGLKLGHGVHTPVSAMELAKKDLSACTAYLEKRYIAGDKDLYGAFEEKFEKHRGRTVRQFISQKLDEAENRHETFQQSRFLVEPDLKEGKGGLRDLDTIGWLYHYAYGRPIGDAADKNVLLTDDLRAIKKSLRFLMTTRMHLHLLRKSNDNNLSFDIQPALADALNYTDHAGMKPAERLMRHYFITATEIGRLTRMFCARLEQEKSKKQFRPVTILPKALQTDELATKNNITIKAGRLSFAKPTKARTAPTDWFRLIRALSRQKNIDVHPDALDLITKNLTQLTHNCREKPENAALFRGIILNAQDLTKTLRILVETGLMAKFIPAFGRITGRIIYGLYRRFTLDEQSIRATAFLKRVQKGKEKTKHPLATTIMNDTEDPYPYYLATLFHELRKGMIGTSEQKMQNITRIARRLGLSRHDSANTGWAATHCQLMIDTVDRRTIADRQTIKQFCNRVGTAHRLDLLLVVTVCNLSVVGTPESDERLNRRLRTLYRAASVWFAKGDKGLDQHLEKRLTRLKNQLVKQLDGWTETDIDHLFEQVQDSAIHAVEPKLWGRFARLMRSADNEGLNAAVSASLCDDGTIEAIILGNDRAGLLTDMAGAISALGLSVRSVQAVTTDDLRIIDVFVLQSMDGSPLEDPAMAKAAHSALLETVRRSPTKQPKLPRRLGDRRKIFDVTPQVVIDLEASDECAVVEAVGLDRPGLLYRLSRALSEIGVIIRTAHVATYGERAVDSFYLQDAPGYKITNKRRLQSIEKRLLNVLAIGPADQ